MTWHRPPDDLVTTLPSVYLAGPCTNWRQRLPSLIGSADVALIDPTREGYTRLDGNGLRDQAAWEQRHLAAAALRAFWLAPPNACAITLMELTQAALSGDAMAVGIDAAYPWRADVEARLSLLRPEVTSVPSIAALAREIGAWLSRNHTAEAAA